MQSGSMIQPSKAGITSSGRISQKMTHLSVTKRPQSCRAYENTPAFKQDTYFFSQ